MKIYRVVCTGGHIYYVEVWLQGRDWCARMRGASLRTGDDERSAVVNACVESMDIAEVRGPGELTTAEQVAAAVEAERARCAALAEEHAGDGDINADDATVDDDGEAEESWKCARDALAALAVAIRTTGGAP